MITKKFYCMLEIIAIFFIVFIVTIFYLNQTWMGLVFNSDILFIPDIFKDLSHGGHFRDWTIATTTMFFPDWLVYFLAYKLTNILYFQFLIVACVNLLLLYLIVRSIYSQFYRRKEALIFSLTSILIFLFFVTKALEPYIFLTVLGQHVGGIIIGLVYIYLHLLLKEKDSHLKIFFILMIISGLMGASDILFLVQFLMPVFVTYIIMYSKKFFNLKKLIFYSLIPLLFSFISFLVTIKIFNNSKIFNLLAFSNLNASSIEVFKYKLEFFLKGFKVFSQFYWPSMFYIVFYVSITFMTTFWFFNKKYLNRKKLFFDQKNVFLALFIFSSTGITILSFIFFDKDLAIRHLEPVFYFPILIFFFIGSFFNNYKLIMKLFNQSAMFIMILFLFYFIFCLKKINTIKKIYYPYEVSCIDSALKNYDHYGVANYWTARPFSLFSREKLHIIEVFNNLSPFTLATNLVRVTDKNAYSFVIMNKVPIIPLPNALEFDEAYVEGINGFPEKVIICGNKKLLIYPKDKFRIAAFTKKNDQFKWPASALPSQFSQSLILNHRAVKMTDGPGFVTFGPYVNLSPGIYKLYISYSSKAAINKNIGYWDISSNISELVLKFDLFGTYNKIKKLSANFTVQHDVRENSYEFRIFSSGIANVNVNEVQLIKLE